MKNMINFIVGVGITLRSARSYPWTAPKKRSARCGPATLTARLSYSLTNLTSMGSQPTQGE
jgi:hypothetical protein